VNVHLPLTFPQDVKGFIKAYYVLLL